MEGALLVRRAHPEDLVDLVRLLFDDELGAKRESFELPLAQSYLDAFARIQANEDAELCVAELAGRVVGTFQLNYLQYLSHQGAYVAQIEAVRILRELRGQGFGREMMLAAIAKARARGCRRVQLTSNKSRIDAHRFYERLGFQATHEGMKLPL